MGCGTGITTCSWDCDKTGIDPAEKLIEKAKKKEGVYIIGQAENLPFEDNSFTCSIQFNTYMDGIAFGNRVADLAEAANHHPDLVVKWRKVDLSLTTHDAGGVTHLDIDLAGRIEELIGVAR